MIWGAFPLYLKPLHDLSALQIIAHRVAWACVLVLAWLFARGELRDLRKPLTNPAILGRLTASAMLITVNWLAYVWGVGHGHVVEASLGYFINPLVNVLLGVVVLRERLNLAQWTAVAIATAAVLYIAVATGATPWISLTIAVSFSTYGLVRKVVHVEALQGLAVETLVLMPVALGYLVWCEVTGDRCVRSLERVGQRVARRLRTDDGGAVVPVCVRRAPHPVLDIGLAALYRAEPAAAMSGSSCTTSHSPARGRMASS